MSKPLLPASPEKTKQLAKPHRSRSEATASFQGSASPILKLQRTLGNQRVAQLIRAKRLTPEGKITVLQPKLTVGAADDQYEQEADRVARHVVRMPDSLATQSIQTPQPQIDAEASKALILQSKPLPLAASITPAVQRRTEATELKAEEEKNSEDENEELLQARFLNNSAAVSLQKLTAEEEKPKAGLVKSQEALGKNFDAGEEVEAGLSQSKGQGSPLPDNIRSYMEPRFGVDFNHVRIHTGSNAIQMNREVGAQAFTHGSDIYYGAGSNPANMELTAHELTHVVQQTGGTSLQPKYADEVSVDDQTVVATKSLIQRAPVAVPEEDEDKEKVAPQLETGANVQEEKEENHVQAKLTPDNIAFSSGHYAPESEDGRKLMAHELTHVVQQTGGDRLLRKRYAPVAFSLRASMENDAFTPTLRSSVVQRDTSKSDGTGDPASPPRAILPTHEGVLIPADPAAQRATLERQVTLKGWDAARGWAVRFINMDLKQELTFQLSGISPETLKSLRDNLNTRLDALAKDREKFLIDFEEQSTKIARDVLAASKQEIKEQAKFLGIKEDTFLGSKTGDWTMDTSRAEGLQAAGRELIAKRKVAEAAANAFFKTKAEADAIFNRNNAPSLAATLPELFLTPELNQRLQSTQAEGLRTAREYDALAAEKQKTYPVLATVTPGSDALQQLSDLVNRKPKELANRLAFIIQEKLDNVATVEKEIGGRFSVWKVPHLRDLTKKAMKGTSWQSRIVEEKEKQVTAKAQETQMFISVVAIGLGLIAAIPTAGASLGVAAAITAAAIGSMALSVYGAYEHYQDHTLESAAQGTTFDRAKAISQGDPPEWFWLALDIATAIVDIHSASAAFKSLKGLIAEARAAETLEKTSELLAASRKAGLPAELESKLIAAAMGDAADERKVTMTIERIMAVFKQAQKSAVDAELADAFLRAANKVIAEGRVTVIGSSLVEQERLLTELVRRHPPQVGTVEAAVKNLMEKLERANGLYVPGLDVIIVKGNRSGASVAATLAHELAHREQQLRLGLQLLSTKHQEFQAFYAAQQFLRNLNIPSTKVGKAYSWLLTADNAAIVQHIDDFYRGRQFGAASFKTLEESAEWILNALKSRK
ncbi:DUF4157 domain-containing protein [Nitrosospira sp. Is2]|uniref:eCIS core domain-containing protein n=1 Tax=Nitrosospira sp. Is2 TaxID=3080532 RepID=UPI002954B23F|nr:DUF4157 domain-containing protein [Nitrosospira sp. Is2]WON73533.1 DUF4157 domain-containing protein [Nitrosospira sp. Is2]